MISIFGLWKSTREARNDSALVVLLPMPNDALILIMEFSIPLNWK